MKRFSSGRFKARDQHERHGVTFATKAHLLCLRLHSLGGAGTEPYVREDEGKRGSDEAVLPTDGRWDDDGCSFISESWKNKFAHQKQPLFILKRRLDSHVSSLIARVKTRDEHVKCKCAHWLSWSKSHLNRR